MNKASKQAAIKAAQKRWYSKNLVKIREYTRNHYAKNREEKSKKARAYYHKNRLKILARLKKNRTPLPVDDKGCIIW